MENEDICSLCGEPGADKLPHPVHWPTEIVPDSEYVHGECESRECERAYNEFRDRVGEEGIKEFLRKF